MISRTKPMPASARHLAAAVTLSCAVGFTANAQEDKEERHVLEEIVVTATLRETNLQETPVAVTALTEQKLLDNFINSVDDVALVTPNVTVAGRRSPLSAPFIIRGLGSNVVGFGLDDAVAQYVNGVYLGRPAASAFNFIDIERLEVLRGPQGTLRGRNSTAGAVSVVSKKPSTAGFEGQVDGELGRYDLYRIRSSVNIPLGNSVAFRGGVYYGDEDGRSVNTYLDRRTDRDFGRAARGSLLFELGDRTELQLFGDWAKYGLQFGFAHVPFNQVREDNSSGNPLTSGKYSNDVFSFSDVETGGASATLDHRFSDSLSLTSITGWRKYQSFAIVDADATTPDVVAAQPVSNAANNLDQTTTEKQDQLSQEVRLNYEGEGPFDVIGGLFFFTEDIDSRQDLGIRGVLPRSLVGVIPGLQYPDILRSYTGTFTNTAWAAFAEVEYELTDRLSASAGVRYSEETREVDAMQQVPPGYFSPTPITGQIRFVQKTEKDYSDVSPSFGLNFKANDDVFLYAKASRAFKSGGFNQTFAQEPFGPENLWAYEIGAKADLLDGTMRVNTAAFHYRYSDLQTPRWFGTLPNTLAIENAGASQSQGLEIEATYAPIERLQIIASVGYLEAEFKDYVTAAGDLSGNRLPGAPEIQWMTDVQYSIPIGAWGLLTPRVMAKHEGQTYFTPENTRNFSHDAYTILNGYLTLEDVDQVWFARLFFENMTDERWRTTAQFADQGHCFCRSNSGPRWYVQLGTRF